MAGPIASLRILLGLDARGVGVGVAQAKAHITGMEAAMGLAGIAIVGVATKSVQAAMEWESSFAGVKKTLDTTGLSVEEEAAAFDELEGALRSMALEIPIGVNELAALAEAGGALGIAREDLTEFVRVAAILGETTDLEASRAAEALGKIGAIVPFTRDEYALFGDVLVDLGNDGASTESAIMDMAQNFAGTASLIGLSKTEMLGWSAAMANVGEGAEAGGSSLSRLFTNVDKAVATTSPKLAGMAEVAGMNADAFAEMYKNDPSGTLEKVVGGLAGMESGARYAAYELLGITDIRVKRAMDKLVAGFSGDRGLTPTLERAALAAQTTGAMMTEAEKRFATTEAQMDLLKNAFNETAITLGTVLLPYVVEIITHVKNGVTAFADWMDQNKELVATLTPIVTVLGGLIALNFGAKMMMTLLPLRGAAQLISGALGAAVPAASEGGLLAGRAFSIAFAAAAVVGVAAAAEMLQEPSNALADDINAWVFGDPAELEKQGGKFAGTVLDSVGDAVHGLTDAATRNFVPVGESAAQGVLDGWQQSMPKIRQAFGDGGLGAGGSWAENAAKSLAESPELDEAFVELQNKLRMNIGEISSTLDGLGDAGKGGMKELRESFRTEDPEKEMQTLKKRLTDLRQFYTRNFAEMGPETLAAWTAQYTSVTGEMDALAFYAENSAEIIGGAIPAELWEGMPESERALTSLLNMHQGGFGLLEDAAVESGAGIPRGFGQAVTAGTPEAIKSTRDLSIAAIKNLTTNGDDSEATARQMGAAITDIFATGITEEQFKVELAAAGIPKAVIKRLMNYDASVEARVAGQQIASSYVQPIAAGETSAREAAARLNAAAIKGVLESSTGDEDPRLRRVGQNITAMYASGLEEGKVKAILLAEGIPPAVVERLMKYDNNVASKNAGKAHFRGYAEGISSMTPAAKDAAVKVSAAALEKFSSRERMGDFERTGREVTRLYALGLTTNEIKAKLAAEGVRESVIKNVTGPNYRDFANAGKEQAGAYANAIAGQAGGVSNSHVSEVIANANLNTAGGAAAKVRSTAAQALSNTAGFRGYGSSTAGEYVGGISSQADAASRAANAVVARVRAAFRANSPPENPLLRPIRSWGQNLIGEWAAGITDAKSNVASAAQGVASVMASSLNPALSAPSFAGPNMGSIGPGSMTVRHEFGPITVNGSVTPEAGREIGRGIGEGMDLGGVMRNLGQRRGLPVEPVR